MDNAAESLTTRNSKNWIKTNLGKIIIVILVLVVAVELFLGSRYFFSPNSASFNQASGEKINDIRPAQLDLITNKSTVKVGETVEVVVKVFTGGYATGGVDLIVKYDPSLLSLDGPAAVLPGVIYSQYSATEIDKTRGMAGMSGFTTNITDQFSGVGTFAKFNFKALKEGKTQVTIDYQGESTIDSNVVLNSNSQDVLGSVTNLNVNVSNSDSSETKASSDRCSGFTQSCLDANDMIGTQVCTSGSIKDGVCGYDANMTVSCGICIAQ